MRVRPRLLIAAALALGLAAALARAAPRLKDGNPVLYYPTAVRERWEPGFEDADGSTKPPLVVASASEKDGVTTVDIDFVDGGGDRSPAFTAQASAGGVCVVATAREGPLKSPRWLLKLPARAGDRWEVPILDQDGKPAVTFRTVGGQEELTTPAGKFTAIRVNVEFPAGKVYQTEWWAPGRGPVKEVGIQTLVLKTVAPGK
jgi:hypothetical protein